MKLMKYIALFLVVAGIFSSCSSDLEKIQIVPDDQMVAPVLKDLAVSEITITPELLEAVEKAETDKEKKKYNFVVEWEKAFFGEMVPCTYTLSFAYNDVELDVLTGVTESNAELTPKQIQSTLKTLSVAANEVVDIKIRVSAQVGSTGKVLYTDYATAKMSYTETVTEE